MARKTDKDWKRCRGSGTSMMLAWFPDATGYPGAVVCVCSFGVLVRKRSAHEAVSAAGFEGMAGTVLTHEVRRNSSGQPGEMKYTWHKGD